MRDGHLFERRVSQQAEAGVDVFIVETFYSVDEVSLAIPFVKQAGVPAVVTLTYRDSEYTREGYRPGEAAVRLVDGARMWWGSTACIRGRRCGR